MLHMLEARAPSRKVRAFIASVAGMMSAVLFMFRPIPLVGLIAAIDLAFVSVAFFFQATFTS
jgi:hypothetical protein